MVSIQWWYRTTGDVKEMNASWSILREKVTIVTTCGAESKKIHTNCAQLRNTKSPNHSTQGFVCDYCFWFVVVCCSCVRVTALNPVCVGLGEEWLIVFSWESGEFERKEDPTLLCSLCAPAWRALVHPFHVRTFLLCPKWHSISHIVHYLWPEPHVHHKGTRGHLGHYLCTGFDFLLSLISWTHSLINFCAPSLSV
jgi:hypothetical protein